jgi:hypothetical protein
MTEPTSRCPEAGVWRAWLDGEPTAAASSTHLADCPACQATIADLRTTAADVTDQLDLLAPDHLPTASEVAAARVRLAQPAPAPRPEPIPLRRPRIPTPWRVALSGLAAAVALTLVVALTPEGQQTAVAFLAQFRPQQVAAVELTPQSQAQIEQTLKALGNLGTVDAPSGARPNLAGGQSASLADASRTVGFPVQTPDPATLPSGFDPRPQVSVVPASQVRFTFDTAKAQQYFASRGQQVTIPPRFDKASIVVSLPAAALVQYRTRDGDGRGNSVLIGQAGQLVVDAQGGASMDEFRDFLLGLPGLPPATVAQLRQIQNWNQTLPVPVPVDRVNWTQTTFHGQPGLLLNDNSGIGSAAVWYQDGRMYGLAGALKATELQRIANSLQVRPDAGH